MQKIEVLKEDNDKKASKAESLSALDVMKRFRGSLKKKGLTKFGKPIGQGTRGVVFPVGGGNVLKVTGDEKEASASSAIKGLNVDGVVKIHDVFKFGDHPFYGILQEKLQPLPKDVVKKLNEAFGLTQFPLVLKKSGYDWDKAVENVEQHTKNMFTGIAKKYPGREKQMEERAQQVLKSFFNIIDEYNIRNYFDALKKVGIDFHDFSGDNLMVRPSDGSIVLIDLGYSKMSRGGNVDTLSPDVSESILRSYIRSIVLNG